jgi:DNA helicase-2/ATP-dependent DNA helicase PcrA
MYTTQDLSQQQKDIINFTNTSNENLMIEAGPGSGKTFMLTQLVYENAGKNILCVVFNTSIKQELQRRIGNLGQVVTVHALGNSLCNYHCPGKFRFYAPLHDSKKGGSPDNKYKLIVRQLLKDNNEHFSLLDEVKVIVDYIQITNTPIYDINAIVNTLDYYNVPFTSHNSIQLAQQAIDIGIRNYKSSRHTSFTDMIFLPTYLNHKAENGMLIGTKDEGRNLRPIDLLLLDECQDLSESAIAILNKFISPQTKVIAVGDSHQSINGFAGALSNSVERLKSSFNMHSLPLTITYRCPSVIVDYVNDIFNTGLIANKSGGDITTMSFDQLSQSLVAGDCVLGRNQKGKGAMLIPLFHSLLRNGIATTVLGIDLLSIAKKHLDEINTDNWNNVTNSFEDYSYDQREFFTEKGWTNKLSDFEDDAYMVNILLDYAKLNHINNYNDFKYKVNEFSREKKGAITLSTMHKSKGGQWDKTVILNSMSLPYVKESNKDWANKAEENLQYVALTRAAKELVLCN